MFTFQTIRLRWSAREWLLVFLPILFFVTPLSSSLKSIFIGIVVAIILISPIYRQQVKHLLTKAWCQCALLLFLIALLECIRSPAFASEQWLVVEKWSKLLYLPILVAGFMDERTRWLALKAFIAAMAITCMLSIMATSGLCQWAHINPDCVFRNHIMTGIMVSFATYLAGFLFFRASTRMRIVYFLLGVLFTYQVLFISHGRTGYVIYFLLIGLLMAQMLSVRQSMVGLVILSASFAGCYYLSQPMQHGISRVMRDVTLYQKNKNTSVGYRMQFHAYAKNLFNQHPWIGNGTGSFTHAFQADNPVPAWRNRPDHTGRLLEPHSQYWLIAAEFGVLGLVGLALFYLSLALAFRRLHAMRPIAYALLLIMLLGNLSDSLLFYSGSGYFLILFIALCLSDRSIDTKLGSNLAHDSSSA